MPEELLITYNDVLAAKHKPALKLGIAQISNDFPHGIKTIPLPPNRVFFGREAVTTLGKNILACAPCSVLNAVRSLGIETYTNIEMLTKRLIAANRNMPLLSEVVAGSNVYYLTEEGIDHAFKLVENPPQEEPLPIQVQKVDDMGVVHQALAHGYSALFVDQHLNHAIAVGGMSQHENEVSWTIIPPDSYSATVIRELEGLAVLSDVSMIKAHDIDPNNLTRIVSNPIWIIGKKDNKWIPPDTELETGEEIVITAND